MYGKPAAADQLDDLGEADLSAVKPFCGDPRRQVTIDDAKEDRFKDWPVVIIEWTIDKDVPLVTGSCDSLALRRVGVLPVGVPSPDFSVTTVDVQLCLLIPCDLASVSDRLALRVEGRG